MASNHSDTIYFSTYVSACEELYQEIAFVKKISLCGFKYIEKLPSEFKEILGVDFF